MGTDSDQIQGGLYASFGPLLDLFGPLWDLFGLAAAPFSRLFSAFELIISMGLFFGLAAARVSWLLSALNITTQTHTQLH